METEAGKISTFGKMVLDQLRDLQQTQKEINEKLNAFVTEAKLDKIIMNVEKEHEHLKNKVEEIEKFYYKFIGALLVINIIGGVVFSLLFKK